jgi:phytoene synthase
MSGATPSASTGLEAEARRSIATGSKSFAGAARLLDPQARASASMLYAWCRYCDDVIDGQQSGFRAAAAALSPAERLATIRRETERVLAGEPITDAPFRALREVVQRHAIDPRYPRDLIEGFAMDVENRRYHTLADTLEYAYHVAGVVGIMMATIMGVRDEAVLDRACDLGIAFQLTNIARDVVEDAQAGRVYLPGAWLAEAGVPAGAIADPRMRAAVAWVTARLLREADAYYASALAGIGALPPRSALAIAAARAVYRAIGRKILRLGPSAWDGRVSTNAVEKTLLTLGALGTVGIAKAARMRPSREDLWTRPDCTCGTRRTGTDL